MKDIDIKTIINFLPFPSNFKLDLLERYDLMESNEQQRVSDLVWEAFYLVYDMKIRENFDKILSEADEKSEKTDEKFYQKVVERTDKEIADALSTSSESVDLTQARKSMEMIIKEINASKVSPKN